MAAYAVMARIERVDPRLAGWTQSSAPEPWFVEPQAAAEAVELVGRPAGATMADRWARLKETWAQTTFYLFDANSWR
jgi:hypothetical protein